ncbi:hypothetical protein SMACR_00494 [Sordaria macrospora]|uniref:Probable aspartic-type endopeptidase OPSB n=2 Tax=Sordaria macrospora TaxID=5147 RepID=F7VL99_SORMK|nr:uncharacterized protein SMAC_00494 [Sordaria macrospora k-hell]KAA8635397.1 hypothetical protein SMACR_00494 [Sordaria macrospora]WPJ59244.1 hypothetical protein SMAC4_00494 [Sordaria macrospora]CCC06276.1 unnamed protein product [Sordaria macrospora k-hell]
MKGCTPSALFLGPVLFSQLALAQQAPSGVVQWDIQKRPVPNVAPNRLLRRAGSTYQQIIQNEQARGGYFATCEMGTPGQKVTLQLDTGSSDVWVPDSTASVCNQGACDLGSFDTSRSKTYKVVGKNEFDISYVDGSSSKGDYFTDVFKIGGATVTNLTMGLGAKTDIAYGLVGVGYANNEAIVSNAQSLDAQYPNLPVTMVDDGLINTIAYSLWLNDLDSSEGNILFGGIDTKKYKGDLTRIKIYPSNNGYYFSFIVAMTQLQAISPSGNDTLTSDEFPIPVVLDSGTTLSYLPQDLVEQVWHEVGADYSSRLQLAVIPCSKKTSKGYFSFQFAGPDGPRINVRMDELVLDLTSGNPPKYTSGPHKGQDVCEFGIQNFTSAPYLLGDTFLRSAYVVYDLVNNEIALAETDFNSTQSNIVAFASMSAPIPSATQAPNQAAVTNRPAVTSPAFSASPGFSDGSGNGGEDENASQGMPRAFGVAQMSVMAVSMVVAMIGSGIFALL